MPSKDYTHNNYQFYQDGPIEDAVEVDPSEEDPNAEALRHYYDDIYASWFDSW